MRHLRQLYFCGNNSFINLSQINIANISYGRDCRDNMVLLIRPARISDFKSLFNMSECTGGGFVNLPADKDPLFDKLHRSENSFHKSQTDLKDGVYIFVIEDTATRELLGTSQIIELVGIEWPIYHYRIDNIGRYRSEYKLTMTEKSLTLCHDLTGCTEVGGLFIYANRRALGASRLLTRSRYMFIKMHRERFEARTIAELRGSRSADGRSPFWDGVTARFIKMDFSEADQLRALRGNRFLADLTLESPIYFSSLSQSAREAIGETHSLGHAAIHLLRGEGFSYDRYIDIFDGGPTMVAATERIKTVASGDCYTVSAITYLTRSDNCLLASGQFSNFRCCFGRVSMSENGIVIDPLSANLLNLSCGDSVFCAPDGMK